ncbi:MAG: energy-coupled thiamine transporter ThiT [Clostridia bacterium]|nr:energy-coupled thiamine transporter ThiT [Clostridia bacterium]
MKNKEKGISVTLRLTESAIMIALATILSLLKLVELPYGGSITFASMLPILLIAYRHGTAWGLLTAGVHGIMQLLLGTGALSYVTGWASVAAVIILDYFLAFALIGLGGIFRGLENQRTALVLGALLAGLLRYGCHVIAGATVWAGLSIPTADALSYSFVYNATYMLPETIVLCLAALYIGGVLNFSSPRLAPLKRDEEGKGSVFAYAGGAVALAALVYDISAVFSCLQNGESGEFDITGISQVNWTWVIIVTAAGAAVTTVFFIISHFARKKG